MANKSLNRWSGVGNLTRDVELKYTSGGTAVATFSLACNNRYKDKEGNWQDGVDFVNLKAWGKQAEILGEYGKRGKQLYAEGPFKTDSWTDKNTDKKVYSSYINVTDFLLLGGGVRETDEFDQRRPEETSDDPYSQPNAHGVTISRYEIPF
jgi:single-strand DNA-binding protein